VVKRIENGLVTVQILNNGKVGSKKNMCLPGVAIKLPTIGKFDEYDIVDFGLKYKVDYIAVSFARYLNDLTKLREFLISRDPVHGPNIHIISKIENHEAIENLD
jgi:pyruvate kinase